MTASQDGSNPLKNGGGHAELPWIFHFFDIVYVGAVYSIGQLFEQCGTDHKVFAIASAYMGIVFMSRYHYDQFALTFALENNQEHHQIVRLILAILCAAIYSIILNIAFNEADKQDGSGHFGYCVRNVTYDNAFAGSFLISRAAILLLFGMMCLGNEKADAWFLFRRKLILMAISCPLICMIYADISPVVAYSLAAIVEFFGELIWEGTVTLDSSVMPNAHLLQERLGLFFMLVLGETMVGTLFRPYDDSKFRRTYGSCMAAYVLVTVIGAHFFERAQSDLKAEGNWYGDENGTIKPSDNSRVREVNNQPENVQNPLREKLTERQNDDDSKSIQKLSIQSAGDIAAAASVDKTQAEGAAAAASADGFNHHPLKHTDKRFYAVYVALHAFCSFAMLCATTGIIEIYYGVEDFVPDTSHRRTTSSEPAMDDGHGIHDYFHLKAQVAGGLATVWLCMSLMELLQPIYYNQLFKMTDKNFVDHQYTKVMLVLKACVIAAHLILIPFPGGAGEGNWFIFWNALVASMPAVMGLCMAVHHHDGSHVEVPWVSHFFDIVYVGAVYSIGQLFEQCGTDHKVFAIASAYTGIIFMSRYHYDQFALTFVLGKGEDHKEKFRLILAGLNAAIFSIILNIAFDRDTQSEGKGHFGRCVRNRTYDDAFATSFLISRGAVLLLFAMKCFNRPWAGKTRRFRSLDAQKLFFKKFVPMLLSSILMCMIFADISPVVVYSCVAFVEFFGELLMETRTSLKLMPNPHLLQERLGLFFMLILGETMVGTLFIFYSTKTILRTYGTCMAAYVLVTVIGAHFFERSQSDVEAPCNCYADGPDQSDRADQDDRNKPETQLAGVVENKPSSQTAVSPLTEPLSPSSFILDSDSSAVDDHTSSSSSSGSPSSGGAGPGSTVQPMSVGHTAGRDAAGQHSVDSTHQPGGGDGAYNHHPLKHPNKWYYVSYVAMHPFAAFAMLCATTGVIEIYYELENIEHSSSHSSSGALSYSGHDDTTDDCSSLHYFHLKAQVCGGLATVWICMAVMELLQPEYFNEFVTLRKSTLWEHKYKKGMWLLKICVVCSHLALMGFPGGSEEGNWFIFWNAFIASMPALLGLLKYFLCGLEDNDGNEEEEVDSEIRENSSNPSTH